MAFTRIERLALAVVPYLAAAVIRVLGMTLRFEDRVADGATQGELIGGAAVWVFWHRSLLACAHRFRHHNIAILISQSFDGELVARTVELLGFRVVRGSSSRGGASALRQMAAAYEEGMRCAFTIDGPRGPAMVAKRGASQLADLVGAEWVGAFYALPERAWVLKTWDGFLIPKPFSRVVMTWPMQAGPSQTAVQAALNESVRMAQSWTKEVHRREKVD